MKLFIDFAKHVNEDDIDLDNKLDNMIDSEINDELFHYISNNEEVKKRIIEYITKNIGEYEEFIYYETMKLSQMLDVDAEDYSNGLYNCDEIYMKAIMNAIGILWNPCK